MTRPTSRKKDLFPVYLALLLAVLAASTVALILAGRPVFAIATAVASVVVAMPLSGWLVAGPYLEADIVVTLRANGGQVPAGRFASLGDERLLLRLARKGVISVADEVVCLNEERIGRGLAFFIGLRMR